MSAIPSSPTDGTFSDAETIISDVATSHDSQTISEGGDIDVAQPSQNAQDSQDSQTSKASHSSKPLEEVVNERPTTKSLLERKDKLIAAMLTRFRNLVSLAAAPVSEGATKEVAAAHAYQMEVETRALIQGAEDLHQFTRELKELWMFGPLRGIGEGEGEGSIDMDAKKVGELVEKLIAQANKPEGN